MSAKHPIPDAALDGRLAIVGLSGSGKSTTAKGGVERLLSQDRRVCVVDLLDGWWGLRAKRDGKTPTIRLWRSIDTSGEWDKGLRDIIECIADVADRALSVRASLGEKQ